MYKICFLKYVVLFKDISMEAKRIEVVKNWLKAKSDCNIPVILGFANFYWQFIQGFNKIVALFTSMLKTTRLPNKSAPSKNDSSRLAFSRNNNYKPASRRNNGNDKINRSGVGKNNIKFAKSKENCLSQKN